MMNTNERMTEKLVNGTPYRGFYIKLKKDHGDEKENWEGYIVNTIFADEIEYIVCKHESDEQRYFVVKPETHICKIKLRMWNNIILDKINITYLPINSNSSTTGHKLQGATLSNLIVNLGAYRCAHWTYVVLCRVESLLIYF